MDKFRIRIEGGSRAFECGRDETVLYAMRMADLRDIEFKCRAGGCGTCRTQVLEGSFATGAMSSEQVEDDDLARHIVLACQLYPRSDLVVRAYRRSIEGVTDQIDTTRVEGRAVNSGPHVPTPVEDEPDFT